IQIILGKVRPLSRPLTEAHPQVLIIAHRSLVTLGILIALRATDELKFHVTIARNNGLTDDEIAEVIYHATGYAGFPAANAACKVAREVIEG
ncbi:carboxymuconolactone decarboxylase family protein, partial [Mycobacterium sp. pV006]|uniref:carboxymuconolactone decarboxylase family protein n=1 Tax=Mycobacterium sp. pV006 TaxID=3238983 RepID=UPI00351B15C8